MDGREGDPYAFLTVLSMALYQEHPSTQALTIPLFSKSRITSPSFRTTLHSFLDPNANASQHMGVALSERLINMPVQIVPHMYRMLVDEIKWAIDDTLTHLLFISRTYTLTQEVVQVFHSQPNPSSPKNKSKKLRSSLRSGAEGEDFGLELSTKVMLVPADKFEGLMRELGEVYVVGG
ncbi:hypothetical protein JAAARDRAFT_442743 [Jaapia argillacea MUCL 33604]|uniref:Uncharacterized protein n=1 Tax=Jaapia argillacea MUCL 33604 TaxID=933084 RepID=A0A067PGS1_9AGAM|nr:hypothetical protein JAAARDRAFT_442743 [Jaapia argillacea MUCL 33604]